MSTELKVCTVYIAVIAFTCIVPVPSLAVPNILVITMDDLAYGDLPSYGGDIVLAPRIESLASQGTRYTAFYSQHACMPSHLAMLTGLYHSEIGMDSQSVGYDPVDWPEHAPTWPLVLQQQGYSTGAFVLWHIGDSSNPSRYGFDVIKDLRAQDPPIEIAYQADWTAGEFLSWKTSVTEPWAAWVGTRLPHSPLEPNQDQLDRCVAHITSINSPVNGVAHTYCASVLAVDDAVGAMLDNINLSNTVVLLYSDNGPPTWDTLPGRVNEVHQLREIGFDCGGLRGYKGTLYECGVRVPLIVSYPGVIAGVSDRLSSLVDFYPSILEWTLLTTNTDGLSGENLLSTNDRTKPIFMRLADKATFDGSPVPSHVSLPVGIRLGDHKTICSRDLTRCETFNVELDPFERLPVNGPATSALQDRLSSWMESLPKGIEPLHVPLLDDGRGRPVAPCGVGFCTSIPCGEWQGSCVNDSQCLPGLVCLPLLTENTSCAVATRVCRKLK